MILKVPNSDSDERAITHLKSNLSKASEPIGYWITASSQDPDKADFQWNTESRPDVSAEDISAPKDTTAKRTERDDCKEWILDELTDGSVDSNDLLAGAEQEGFSKATYIRARSELKEAGEIQKKKDGGWKWSLIKSEEEGDSQDTHPPADSSDSQSGENLEKTHIDKGNSSLKPSANAQNAHSLGSENLAPLPVKELVQ